MGTSPVQETLRVPRRFVFDLDMSRFGPGVKGRVFCDTSGINRADSAVLFTVPSACQTFPFPDQDEAWNMLNFRTEVIVKPHPSCAQGWDRVLVVALPVGQRLAVSLQNLGLILGKGVVPSWADKEVGVVPFASPSMGMG